MTLSIIVPVYNVEPFLRRCLDSLLRQGLEVGEYEIVCINDGSTDGSGAILDAYVMQYPDVFRVVTQRNMGLAEVRITGIKEVRGEYVAFVDADDYVIDGGYRYLIDHFLEKKPDVVQFFAKNVYTDGQKVVGSDCGPEGKVLFEGDGAEMFNKHPHGVVWSKLYKRTALGPRFTDSFRPVICEDVFFNFSVFWEHPTAMMVNSNIYRYEQNNGISVLKTKNKKKVMWQLKVLLDEMDIMAEYLQEGLTDLAPAARHYTNVFLNIFYMKLLSVHLSRKEWRELIRQLKQRPQWRVACEDSRFTSKVVAQMKNLSASSYEVYSLIHLLHQKVFKRYIFPRMHER